VIPHRNVARTAEQARNLEVFAAYNTAFSKRDLDGALSYLAEDAGNHGRAVGRAGFGAVFSDIFRTYTVEDNGVSVERMVAVDDSVVIRFILHHRHTGVSQIPIDGGLLMGKPPSGRSCKIQHIHWYKFRDGLIVDHRASRDDIGMMSQFGLLPAPLANRA
jgi:predicted ester cyclase